MVRRCRDYLPDARVVAAAHECGADFLLTYDRAHLLENPLLTRPDVCCLILTSNACLAAVSARLREAI